MFHFIGGLDMLFSDDVAVIAVACNRETLMLSACAAAGNQDPEWTPWPAPFEQNTGDEK